MGKAGLRNRLYSNFIYGNIYAYMHYYYAYIYYAHTWVCVNRKTWNIPNVHTAYPIGLQNTFISLNLSIY